MDLAAEGRHLDLDQTKHMQQLKTGALIEFAVEAPCILAGLTIDRRGPYREFARDLGLAFQIADDLIDYSGDEATAGKRTGKDVAAGKATFVSLLGCDGARVQAEKLVTGAVERLSHHGPEADLLRAIARFAIERDR